MEFYSGDIFKRALFKLYQLNENPKRNTFSFSKGKSVNNIYFKNNPADGKTKENCSTIELSVIENILKRVSYCAYRRFSIKRFISVQNSNQVFFMA